MRNCFFAIYYGSEKSRNFFVETVGYVVYPALKKIVKIFLKPLDKSKKRCIIKSKVKESQTIDRKGGSMANISDIIERFLLDSLEKSDRISISRNELADYFDCAPSQINYVLSTRFTLDRGYIIESRRGGGGYVTLLRIGERSEILDELAKINISEGVSYNRAMQIADRLVDEKLMTEREGALIKALMSDKALVAPGIDKDILRASLIKNLSKELSKQGEE